MSVGERLIRLIIFLIIIFVVFTIYVLIFDFDNYLMRHYYYEDPNLFGKRKIVPLFYIISSACGFIIVVCLFRILLGIDSRDTNLITHGFMSIFLGGLLSIPVSQYLLSYIFNIYDINVKNPYEYTYHLFTQNDYYRIFFSLLYSIPIAFLLFPFVQIYKRNRRNQTKIVEKKYTPLNTSNSSKPEKGSQISPVLRFVIFPLVVYAGKTLIDQTFSRTSNPTEGLTIALISTLALNLYIQFGD